MLLVENSDAVVDPGAVVVHPRDAPPANRAVVRIRGLQRVAFLTHLVEHRVNKSEISAVEQHLLRRHRHDRFSLRQGLHLGELFNEAGHVLAFVLIRGELLLSL